MYFIQNGDTLIKEWRGFFDNDTLRGFRFELADDEKNYGLLFDNVQKGLYELLHFKARNFDDMLMFSFYRDKHRIYNGMPDKRAIELIVHGLEKKPTKVTVGGYALMEPTSKLKFEKQNMPAFYFDNEKSRLFIKFNWGRNKEGVQVQY